MDKFVKLLNLAKRKSDFDEDNDWYQGSGTYIASIQREIDELIEEIPNNRRCYLEEEIGDVLWNYLNIMLALEKEGKIDLISALSRTVQKYHERMEGIEAGKNWKDIKAQQKLVLAEEYAKEKKANKGS